MDFRRDLLVPFLALAVSISLHIGLVELHVPFPDRAEDLDLTPVTVEYLPAGKGAEEPSGQETPGKTATKPEAPPPVEPQPATEAKAVPAEKEPPPALPPAEPSPTPPPESRAEPVAQPPPIAQEITEPPPPAPTLPAQAQPGETSEGQPDTAGQPKLQDLLPRAEDLRPYAQTESATPDPTSGQAQEVTLTLGDTDVRYRGYLQQVQASIDRSWRWREALLAAGGGGQVLVRFSLGPGGQVEDVGIAESSGSPVLDREAADAVRRAPMPAFPAHWTLQRLNLFAQFAYRLE